MNFSEYYLRYELTHEEFSSKTWAKFYKDFSWRKESKNRTPNKKYFGDLMLHVYNDAAYI